MSATSIVQIDKVFAKTLVSSDGNSGFLETRLIKWVTMLEISSVLFLATRQAKFQTVMNSDLAPVNCKFR